MKKDRLYDHFGKGTPMGDHWKKTLIVEPIQIRVIRVKSNLSRAQRKAKTMKKQL